MSAIKFCLLLGAANITGAWQTENWDLQSNYGPGISERENDIKQDKIYLFSDKKCKTFNLNIHLSLA